MSNFSISGLDDFSRTLSEATEAAKSLEDDLGTLSIDPSNPQATVREMERRVDAKLARFGSNPVVAQIGEGVKNQYREMILTKAAEARGNPGN